ncbi:hypothetical protein [Mycoplasmopsis glycophila]|uniref:hypothetical protein n=1 Tax=Mycoplasmopsis glycophila TaxID=171285 RepID=UPI00101C09A9|nr:hypothetical protein [Mycoplasmopsis glycophila]
MNITNIIRLEAFFNGTTYFLVWLEYFWYIFVGVLIFIILFILSIIELATRVMVINEDYTFYLKNAITKRKKLIKMSDIIIVDNSPLKIKWPTSNIFGKQLFVSFIIDQTDEKEFIAILNDSKKPQEPVTNENI